MALPSVGVDGSMNGYTARDVAKLLGLSVGQVRSYARSGFLEPRRGRQGEYRFSFQDLVLLRTAKGLLAGRIPARKVRRSLRKLKERLPRGRPLTAVQIVAQGDRILVRDGTTVWNPESGQTQFDFDVAALARKVAPLARQAARAARAAEDDLTAEDWYQLGCDLEAVAPDHARDAYRRALELDPRHADARLNIGRFLHEAGRLEAAEAHYRLALTASPRHATAAFNLGVCLEDQGRHAEALDAYHKVIATDATFADAYYNAARLLEQAGNTAAALRYLRTYRQLTEPR
jgi:tetratricopeptide (TPR) repeat protein